MVTAPHIVSSEVDVLNDGRELASAGSMAKLMAWIKYKEAQFPNQSNRGKHVKTLATISPCHQRISICLPSELVVWAAASKYGASIPVWDGEKISLLLNQGENRDRVLVEGTTPEVSDAIMAALYRVRTSQWRTKI